MYTFKEVVEKLSDAQVSGGRIVVYRAGKHIDIGRVASETGVFILTPDGLGLMNAQSVVETVDAPAAPAEPPAPRKTKAAKAAARDDDLSDLDFE